MAGDLLPYFHMYAAETLSDERFSQWNVSERGAWLTLVLHAWVNGSIPSERDALARIVHMPPRAFDTVWRAIGDRFVAHPDADGRLTSARLEIEREKAQARASAGKAGATSRWNKKTGMRPQCDRNATAEQSQCLTIGAPNAPNPAQPSPDNPSPEQAQVGSPVPTPSDEGEPLQRVLAIWNEVCVPVGYAKALNTPRQRKFARTRMRQAGWFDAFKAACAFLAVSPFYRGENDRGWCATVGWLLEKPDKAAELAERGSTKRPQGSANGRSQHNGPGSFSAEEWAQAERECDEDLARRAASKADDDRDGRGVRCPLPLDAATNGIPAPSGQLPAALRALVVHRGSAGDVQDPPDSEPRA